MGPGIPLHPEQASTIAQGVDHLYFFLTGVTLFFTILIFSTIFYFAVKYRRRSEDDRPEQVTGNVPLEVAWTVIPAIICGILFVWASSLYFRNSRPPAASTEVFVIGKQWMWHLQHPEGAREIDELHVPVNVPIKLTMISQDVIHGFFIPAFRIKRDVLPNRYNTIWFQATKPGRFHFFCTEYCGAQHSEMTGWVDVMKQADYQRWLTGGVQGESMAQAGERLYGQLGCTTCHGTGRAPSFVGLYGKPVKLTTGETVIVDDAYIRESILTPSARPVAGYPTIMPTFKGQVNEEQILQLIAYIKSQAPQPGTGTKLPERTAR